MIAFPPCKINLGLYVTEKRSDGYHNLDTCFYPVPFTDVLEVIPATKTSFSSSGIHIPGRTEDNLCLKAYTLLKNSFDIPPVEIHLHKMIPSGAGLGGGSSDAAYTLRLLNAIFNIGLDTKTLMQFAAQLGSDCAFFIQDESMIGSGRGEILESCTLRLAGKFLVLIKPDIHVSTAEAYAGIVPKRNDVGVKQTVENLPVDQWRNVLCNDFETSVFKKYPIIGDVKTSLYDLGAEYSIMSGSGSTVAAIFSAERDIDNVKGAPVIWKGYLT